MNKKRLASKESLVQLLNARKRARDQQPLLQHYHALGSSLYRDRLFERLFKLRRLQAGLRSQKSSTPHLVELEAAFIDSEIQRIVDWLRT